uniref:PB1 domain-containing protein n=1 Tax=Physcomitrium patens TaxID=3218 RepID=A0A2K1KB15_PHYPA|nr:hypothetical protein PHYPA_010154 [Physcomitrium patens]
MYTVFKVKYGDVLRRFRLCTSGLPSGELELVFRELLDTISSSFNFPRTMIPTITYTDLDGDVVTIADYSDFEDIVYEQKMNPVHMTLTVSTPSSNEDASPQKSSTVGIPPWAGVEDQKQSDFFDLLFLLTNVSFISLNLPMPISTNLIYRTDRKMFAADIMLKLDQVLEAVNNHFVESAVESMMPTSRALEQIAAKLGISMNDEPVTEPAKSVLRTQKGTPDKEQSGPESEVLQRFFILQQRALNESKDTTAASEDSETYVF